MRVHDLPQSALELAALVRRRALSAVEVVRHHLEVIAEKNPDLGAFVELREDRALHEAERIDERIARGGDLPPFLGLPTGIKDHEHLRGCFTRAGSRALRWVYSPVDGFMARACRRAGFVLCGKLATSELTILPFIETELHPPARNPYSRAHYAGGSSGGSAAAVASGMLPIAPGSDGAGSIRIPAACCGLWGMKASRGALPNPYGAFDRPLLSSIGPLAHTVRDAAALMDVLAGERKFASACDEAPRRGLRVRLLLETPLANVDEEHARAARAVALQLEDFGHHVEEGEPLDGVVDDFVPLMARMVANVPVVPFTERWLEPTTRWLRQRGKRVPQRVAMRQKEDLEKRVLAWFGEADLWITPTMPIPIPLVGSFRDLDGEAVFRAAAPLGAFTAAFNVSGQPAINVPRGRSSAGLPIGVQVVGRRDSDRLLLSLAAMLEEESREEASVGL